jgi:hypothetical protein
VRYILDCWDNNFGLGIPNRRESSIPPATFFCATRMQTRSKKKTEAFAVTWPLDTGKRTASASSNSVFNNLQEPPSQNIIHFRLNMYLLINL